MCEPNHSVTQWATPQAVEQAVVQAIEPEFLQKEELENAPHFLAAPLEGDKVVDEISQWWVNEKATRFTDLQLFLGEDGKLLSQDGEFYHLSRFGEGHHESRRSKLGQVVIPAYTSYEVQWWNRVVRFDLASGASTYLSLDVRMNARRRVMYGKISDIFKKEALNACERYALKTSIGSPQILRRFLEETILTSVRLGPRYREVFDQLFSPKGVIEFENRLKLANIRLDTNVTDEGEIARIRLAKIVCGLTRTRIFLCPEWADVTRFWKN